MPSSLPRPVEPLLLPEPLRVRLNQWLHLWETPALCSSLRVEVSPRMRRAFGRCYQTRRLIRLTPSLLSSQSHLLEEVLCHEAAHAAVYEKLGPSVQPHGSDWQALMRSAGFEPRIRLPFAVDCPPQPPRAKRARYLHRCPVCRLSRGASRPMHAWRCRTCIESSTKGELEIQREGTARPAMPARAAAALSRWLRK